jgi:hypothetical protein
MRREPPIPASVPPGLRAFRERRQRERDKVRAAQPFRTMMMRFERAVAAAAERSSQAIRDFQNGLVSLNEARERAGVASPAARRVASQVPAPLSAVPTRHCHAGKMEQPT